MKKYDVHCPFCIGVFLETNGLYREDKPANGSMFAAKQHIVDAGWSTFPLLDSSEYDNVICPSCSQPLLDSAGRLIRKQCIGEIDVVAKAPVVVDNQQMDALFAEYEPGCRGGR